MSSGAEELTRSCPDCGQESPYSQRFCESCGSPLRSSDRGKATNRRRLRAAGDSTERTLRREFARIKEVVFILRAIYVIGAFGSAAMLMVLFWKLGVPVEVVVQIMFTPVMLCYMSELALTVVGAVLLPRAPLVWSVILAATWTLSSTVVMIVTWEIWTSLTLDPFTTAPLLTHVVLALTSWAALTQAARVQSLMAKHPDLELNRSKLDPARRVRGGVAEGARERQREARMKAIKLGIPSVAIVGLSLALWMGLTGPPTVNGTVDTFAAAWGRGDVRALRELFPVATGPDARNLEEEISRRGWDDNPPRLSEPAITMTGEHVAEASFDTGDDRLRLRFRMDDRETAWHLSGFIMPEIDTPDLEPAIRQFQEAWASEGPGALFDLFSEDYRLERGDRVLEILERRGWDRRRPTLGRSVRGRSRPGDAFVESEIASGETIRVRWSYWHPRWVISLIQFLDD